MRFKLIPTDDRFFALFREGAANTVDCARRLREFIEAYDDVPTRHAKVVECEHEGDRITREILRRLDSSFVTPFDREDIHALAEEMDDVVDDMLAVSELLTLLPIDAVLPEMKELADLLVRMTEQSVGLFDQFESMKGVQRYLDAIDTLESEGDSIHRRTIARLFRDYEALDVLKWKDVVAAMEGALNTVEDISNIVESIVLKHA